MRDVAEIAAASVGCHVNEVFMASTGVIGEPLPSERITKFLADWPNRVRRMAGAMRPKPS